MEPQSFQLNQPNKTDEISPNSLKSKNVRALRGNRYGNNRISSSNGEGNISSTVPKVGTVATPLTN